MKSLFTLPVFLLFSIFSFSQDPCVPPTGQAVLDINNVAVNFNVGQAMWGGSFGTAGYEYPKGSGTHVAYQGNFWMGGVTPDQQLKLAAGAFYTPDVTDFYAGPLNFGDATPVDCEAFDFIYVAHENKSLRHKMYFDCLDQGCDLDYWFPFGYEIPSEFYAYPAQYLNSNSELVNLAPWFDFNSDGLYEPADGDCPLFEGMPGVECPECDALRGHQCLIWVDNDAGGLHLSSQGDVLGIQILNMAYAFSSGDALNDQSFYAKKVLNAGSQTLNDTRMGIWADGDLGTAIDDYIGSDIGRNLLYFKNGDPDDEPSSTSFGYGEFPPAFGIKLLQGPIMDADGEDNDGDGETDNETHGMTSAISYAANSGTGGAPTTPLGFYNYLDATWLDGSPLLCGGEGDDFGEPTNWMFAGDTYPNDCYWTAATSGISPGDRRGVLGSGEFTFNPGDEQCFQFAGVIARASNEDDPVNEDELKVVSDFVQEQFDDCFSCFVPSAQIMIEDLGDNTYAFMTVFNTVQDAETVVTWDFGDGTTTTDPFPYHQFANDQVYSVTVTIESPCGEATETIDFDTSIVSVDNLTNVELSVYPNPSSDVVSVKTSASNGVLTLLDLTGKQVQQSRISLRKDIDVKHLSKGVYFIRILDQDSNAVVTQKLLVN